MSLSVASDPASSSNRSTYESQDIVGQYARSTELYPAEEHIFRRYQRQFSRSVLDIAIGAGRTTRALLPGCERYAGLDISEGMVASAREHFPKANLRVMDMRNVPRELANEKFDAILISFNGIDYIQWDERCALLAALPALLAADGVFVFSTHNLADADVQRGFHLRQDLRAALHRAYNPRSLAKFVLRGTPWMLKAWRNRRRNRPLERAFDGYAYVNDAAEDYGVLTLYVLVAKQLEILRTAGFSRIEMLQPWLKREQAYFNYFACQT